MSMWITIIIATVLSIISAVADAHNNTQSCGEGSAYICAEDFAFEKETDWEPFVVLVNGGEHIYWVKSGNTHLIDDGLIVGFASFKNGLPIVNNTLQIAWDIRPCREALGPDRWDECAIEGWWGTATMSYTLGFKPGFPVLCGRFCIFPDPTKRKGFITLTVPEPDPPEPEIFLIDIDIKPGDDTNTINLCSMGVIPAVLYGWGDFDVSTIDIPTLRLGDAYVKLVGKSKRELCIEEYHDADEFYDLNCKFVTIDIAAADETIELSIFGSTYEDGDFFGTDMVNIVKDNCE